MNLLKAGILFANSVVLPGPRYVSEAQTRAYGCGLDPVLREQAGKLEGITNGLDATAWNPATDKALPKRYKNAAEKTSARKPWLTTSKLSPGGMQFLVVTDAMTADGMDALLPALDRILESNARVAVLGKVSPANVSGMEFARRRHEGRFTWLPDTDENTLRLALAGSDALLCPAPVAPDATTFLRALSYGVLPVCASSGGLHALAPAFRGGAGFAFPFFADSVDALVDAVRHAASAHRDAETWNAAVERAMAADFSWSATATVTEALYTALLGRNGLARAA
jgi:starch synthase